MLIVFRNSTFSYWSNIASLKICNKWPKITKTTWWQHLLICIMQISALKQSKNFSMEKLELEKVYLWQLELVTVALELWSADLQTCVLSTISPWLFALLFWSSSGDHYLLTRNTMHYRIIVTFYNIYKNKRHLKSKGTFSSIFSVMPYASIILSHRSPFTCDSKFYNWIFMYLEQKNSVWFRLGYLSCRSTSSQ